jgi:hypothetical protein
LNSYLVEGLSQVTKVTAAATAPSAQPTLTDATEAFLYLNSKCNGNNVVTSDTTNRNAAVIVKIEGGTQYCTAM